MYTDIFEDEAFFSALENMHVISVTTLVNLQATENVRRVETAPPI